VLTYLPEPQEVGDAVPEVAEGRVQVSHQVEGHAIVGEHLGICKAGKGRFWMSCSLQY
jgi:hypothetical protein